MVISALSPIGSCFVFNLNQGRHKLLTIAKGDSFFDILAELQCVLEALWGEVLATGGNDDFLFSASD